MIAMMVIAALEVVTLIAELSIEKVLELIKPANVVNELITYILKQDFFDSKNA
jgi:hypothetical protein